MVSFYNYSPVFFRLILIHNNRLNTIVGELITVEKDYEKEFYSKF
jgi:hypothetical protein